jgi:hypothetical protein
MHWQCSSLDACRSKAQALVKSKLDAGFDLVSLVELENFLSLPPTPDHNLLMNVIAQNPSARLDDTALLWFNTKTFKKVDSGPIFFGGINSNGTAPTGSQKFYVGNWAQLQRNDDGSKYLVVQGHFSHDLLQSGAALKKALPSLSAIVSSSANIIMLADTNDNQMTDDQVRQSVFGWKSSYPAPKPVTNPPGSTCCFEPKECSAGKACCWSPQNQNPYDKFLVRVANAAKATQTVEMVDLAAAGLGDSVLNAWGCENKPGGGEMHRPVQVEIELCKGPSVCTGVSAGLAAGECAAWQELYDATNGPKWSECSDARSDPCSCSTSGPGGDYAEVRCTGGHIIYMQLVENNLRGTIPSSLAKLSKMTALALAYNRLTGLVPSLPFAQYTGNVGCRLDSPSGQYACTEPNCNHFKCPLPAGSKQCKDEGAGVHCK